MREIFLDEDAQLTNGSGEPIQLDDDQHVRLPALQHAQGILQAWSLQRAAGHSFICCYGDKLRRADGLRPAGAV